ncbi:MAG TPA: 3-deoxy-7-phosphoheptulonate synthase [Usitatibacter sp.]|nr:3-deoxy-7-phosphoheptulonate synthase [Usitatibacter sp.]
MSKAVDEFRILGRRKGQDESIRFEYQGVRFDQDCFHVVAGLNAVDTREFVDQTFRALKEAGQVCARMGAYKPRTSPYSFQGYGKQCLPYVFELAGKYGIRVVAMEVTRDEHLDEIRDALQATGNPCGVMLQIGTRNTQNFELLKAVGSQRDFPILLKRGFGITLHESLLAAEYVASSGNRDIAFCLRGMKTNFGDPHRNLIDFGHVPVVKRLTRMPVCIDPSHSVGTHDVAPDGLPDVFHVAAQGIIAGANLVLTDVHPEPKKALVDAAQALTLEELPRFLADCAISREAYEKRRGLR